MSEHLPDVQLTDEQDDRATALERAVIERPASAACLIVYLQDEVEFKAGLITGYECRIAELTESLRQQESQLRTALDELRQPAGNPFDKSKAVFAGKSKDGYLLKCWFESQEDLDAAFDVVERLPVTTEATR